MPDTRDTRDSPVKPNSSSRQPAPDEVLLARPVEGDIDYPKLIRETMARFPKILAALAK